MVPFGYSATTQSQLVRTVSIVSSLPLLRSSNFTVTGVSYITLPQSITSCFAEMRCADTPNDTKARRTADIAFLFIVSLVLFYLISTDCEAALAEYSGA